MVEIQSNTRFCHFTSTENARKIISGGKFFLNKYSRMNDLAEAELHTDENDRVFSLSLCNSEALNIPLFYLHGGIDGKGCRLQFTASRLQKWLNNTTVHYVNKRGVCLKKAVDPAEYDIIADWVYYISSDGYCDHAGSHSKYSSFSEALDELYARNRHYFVKSPVWKFEKEFRIVVKFKHDVPYDKIALSLEVQDPEQGISLVSGPEYEKQEFLELQHEFDEYGIQRVTQSSYHRISMRLADRNNTGKII